MESAYSLKDKRKVKAIDAIKGIKYVCLYCGEENLILRKGNHNRHAFAHKKASKRTPLERTCPEYKGQSPITGDSDKLYIQNGGIPVYLHKNGNDFYIDAIFPMLSDKSLQELINQKAKLHIEDEIYNIEQRLDMIYYRLEDTKSKWIYIKFEGNIKKSKEVEQKWLWGIRGLYDVEQSLFQCNMNGGYRVSPNNCIYVNKKYYAISKEKQLRTPGIIYEKQGEITLNHKYYYVFTFQITNITLEVQNEVNRRQYVLCEKSSYSNPIWPPCNILGNQLIYTDDRAFFYQEINEKEKLSYHNSQNDTLLPIYSLKNCFIIYPKYWNCLYSSHIEHDFINGKNRDIPIQNIQWHITYKSKKTDSDKKDTSFYLINDLNEIINEGDIQPYITYSIKTDNDISVKVIIKQGEYVICVYKQIIENISPGSTVILDAGSYGQKRYNVCKINKSNPNENYSVLLKVKGINVNIDSVIKRFYHKIKNTHPQVARKVNIWIKSNCIPLEAKKLIYKYMKAIT